VVGIHTWIDVAYLTPVTATTVVFLICPIGQRSFSDGIPLRISGTFNFIIVFQVEHNIIIHPFMLGVADAFDGSLSTPMHGALERGCDD
jgi:photosystem II P680 reaction center D1 protein